MAKVFVLFGNTSFTNIENCFYAYFFENNPNVPLFSPKIENLTPVLVENGILIFPNTRSALYNLISYPSFVDTNLSQIAPCQNFQ